MEYYYALLLTFFEMTFVFVGLGLLYFQRRAIGKAPFYMSVGLLMVFAYLLSAAQCRVALGGGLEFQLSSMVIVLPVLAAFLMVYITEGTLEAQRLIIGMVVLFGLFLYISELTRLQCNWHGFSFTSGIDAVTLDRLLGESRNAMALNALSNLLEMFAASIIYTRLRNYGVWQAVAIIGALLAALGLGLLVDMPQVFYFNMTVTGLGGDLAAQVAARIWFGLLLAAYLGKIEVDIRSGETSPLDIVFAFVGSYGRSKELEKNLREWTDRYRLVLENAGELIVMMNSNGRIVDGNIAAAQVLGAESPEGLVDKLLFPRLTILDHPEIRLDDELAAPVHFRAALDNSSPRRRMLRCSLSPVSMEGKVFLTLIASDITEETKLIEEKSRLSEQLAHSQRIESLGMLAGGIAHDFNNYIHAILGHIDVICYMHQPDDPDVMHRLEKISAIAEQAGHLTSQLLGYARKGKYQETDLDIRQVIKGSLSLLGPRKQRDLAISTAVADNLPPVRGDALQLQQVMLNLMINALDAMEDNKEEQKLKVSAGFASELPMKLTPPPEIPEPVDFSRYVYLCVADNGCGMDKATRMKIFEPFFTTKPVGLGTGMGLAMVYGTVTNHHGWLQVESEKHKGTKFYIFLPGVMPDGE